ncbi:MAG: hypothetical protein J5I65_00760 [Aridibacter famidurans]|nr:hypothetical protein [Aridibacter famidurans]
MNFSELPQNIRSKATILSNEPAWSKATAIDVISYLESHGLAVIAVEIWHQENDVPRVVGWSEYEIVEYEGWKEYVEKNALNALDIVEKGADDRELYNLTWISETEFRELNKSRR